MPHPRLRLPRGRFLLPALALSALSPVCGLQAQTLLSHYTLNGTTADAGSVNAGGTLNGSATFGASGSGVGLFDQALVTGQTGASNYFQRQHRQQRRLRPRRRHHRPLGQHHLRCHQ